MLADYFWFYHFYSISLRRLCSCFVPPSPALAASLLFAVHPVHTEAVTGVVGRAELLSSVFFILALLSYREAALRGCARAMAACVACVGMAMLCKEQVSLAFSSSNILEGN